MSRSIKTPALAAAISGSLMLAGSAFAATPLAQGYMLGADAQSTTQKDAKAAEAKCGAEKDKKAEGTCGAAKAKAAEGKCGEGKCGAKKADAKKTDAKAMEGKGGEGKCGGAA